MTDRNATDRDVRDKEVRFSTGEPKKTASGGGGVPLGEKVLLNTSMEVRVPGWLE